MRRSAFPNIVLPALLLGAVLLFPGQVLGGAAQSFRAGWQQFHQLRKNSSQAKYRANWMEVKEHFSDAYKDDPQGEFAPKSLYYLGRTYQELGRRSYLEKDFRTAVDYFQRVVLRFPSHSWSDDAKLYKAKIHLNHLDQTDQAYMDLLYIVHNYPDGDKVQEAKELLRQMDVKNVTAKAAQLERAQQKARGSSAKGSVDISKLHRLTDVRHWSSDEYTRVVLDLDRKTKYEHFLLEPDPRLDKPYRLVVDLYETMLPDKVESKLRIQDGILRRVRTGQNRKSKARVVLDIKDLNNYRVFTLQNPYRVVVDVYAPGSGGGGKSGDEQMLASIDETPPGNLIEQLGLKIERVMIDPGHGGKDPGAVRNGEMEKDINLRMAKILGKILKKRGYEVIYTRTSDSFVPLEERTAMANAEKADLFISIHVNAHNNSRVRGFELYTLNMAQSKEAKRVAARENSVSMQKISDLQVILTDLMLNSKIKESQELAQLVNENTVDYCERFYNMRDHGVREAPFYVLIGAKMPAMLVEMGYLSNPRERKWLQSYAYLKRLAWGLAEGVDAYKKKIMNYASLNAGG
jgi:N-acetylmuramoyl-L-alanine amidase